MFDALIRFVRSRGLVPRLSPTEREALAAGTVWIEGALFSGRPDFRRILAEPYPSLTPREQAFLDGPVEEVCAMVDDWEVTRTRQLPPEVLPFLRAHGFFGLVIPQEYGGLGFSALGCSAVFGKLGARSLPLSALVLLPNSVGPGELLVHYGTDAQKQHYLPRLARGEEIPCFALTEPEAGSDAASLRSRGRVFRGPDGRLLMRLEWSKRYITLAPIATLLGLAVRLEDPERLLGGEEDVGITCVLVPTDVEGVRIGRRHDPMGIPFPNGPTEGRDVVLPVDQVIGGAAGAGRGWRMLMEALAAGRSISLPGQAAGGARAVARVAGAYAAVREQFGLAIGRFEGIEEPLARIGGFTYLMDAARVFTCGAVDGGSKPAVVSAIVKYQQTELVRRVVQDAMDVLGGAAICRGPRNLLASAHAGTPIGITVEGANILTRTLIVYGQGALRCHPYAQKELAAVEAGDGRALVAAVAGHAVFALGNVVRAAALALTRGWMAAPGVDGPSARHVRRLAWASASFAALSDLALVALGSRLKQQGKLTGRFADALSWMYLATAAVRRFEAEGRRPEDRPFLDWAAGHALAEVQRALEGVLENLDAPLIGPVLRGPVALLARLNRLGTPPSDVLGGRVAAALVTAGAQRERLTGGLASPRRADEAAGRLERAFTLVSAIRPLEERLRQAIREGRLPRVPGAALADAALASGVLDAPEHEALRLAAEARADAIQVDSFPPEEYFAGLAAEASGPEAVVGA